MILFLHPLLMDEALAWKGSFQKKDRKIALSNKILIIKRCKAQTIRPPPKKKRRKK